MGRYALLDHTSEVGVEAWADSPEELFAQVAEGMFSFMLGDLSAVRPLQERTVEVEGTDRGDLLVRWLNELLYIFEVEGLALSQFDVKEAREDRLRAVCRGEPYDRRRHPFHAGVKSATYHMLEVSRRDGQWYARVILDV